jgi:hypothetical protein
LSISSEHPDTVLFTEDVVEELLNTSMNFTPVEDWLACTTDWKVRIHDAAGKCDSARQKELLDALPEPSVRTEECEREGTRQEYDAGQVIGKAETESERCPEQVATLVCLGPTDEPVEEMHNEEDLESVDFDTERLSPNSPRCGKKESSKDSHAPCSLCIQTLEVVHESQHEAMHDTHRNSTEHYHEHPEFPDWR